MFDSRYYLNLILNKPIVYDGLKINIVSLREIFDYGLDRYDDLMLPFSLTPLCFNKPIDSVLRQGILTNIELINPFCEMLSLATGYDECRLTPEYIDLIFSDSETFRIDDSNYDDICDIILKMNAKKKIEIIEHPPDESERLKSLRKKIQKGRQDFESKNKVNLWDIINICEFAGDYYIPISEIEKWSLWKIGNCYNARVDWKSYNDDFEIAIVNGDNKRISDGNHWYRKFMVRE